MRRLPLPSMAVCDVYTAALIAFGNNADFHARLVSAQPEVLNEEASYKRLARAGRLDLVKQSKTVNMNLSVADMKDFYKYGMSSFNGPARIYYDQLKNAAPHGTCPLCGQGKVHNLDHHLPQSKYPTLVVTPANLVPACRDCNAAKLAKSPMAVGEQTIHPYFDDFTGARWLHAEISISNPPAVLFSVKLPDGWPIDVEARLRQHIKVFKLNAAFTLYASEELSQIASELQWLHKKGGSNCVREELRARAQKREESHRNSWQTAMYYGLAASDWFCEEGLFLLKPTPFLGIAA